MEAGSAFLGSPEASCLAAFEVVNRDMESPVQG